MNCLEERKESHPDFGLTSLKGEESGPVLGLNVKGDVRHLRRTQRVAQMEDGKTIESIKTTTMVDEGEVKKCDLTSKVIQVPKGPELDSIKDFLGKPYRIGTFNWTYSAQIGSNIMQVKGLDALTGANINPHYRNKLEGFGFLKADFNVRVILNSNPFQQGELICRWVPIAATLGNQFTGMHSTIVEKSQMPHMYMNCRDSVVEMTFPYITPADAFEIYDSDRFDWGTFYVDVMSPLKFGAGSEDTAQLSVFVYYTNVQLSGPMIAQSKSGFKKYSVKDIPSQEQIAVSSGGSISKALSTVSLISASLSAVPAFSAIAAPAAWLSALGAGVASYFGYSKPVIDTPPCVMLTQPDRYGVNSDGAGVEVKLATRHDNAISLTDQLSIYPDDEMSWNFLKQRETYSEQVLWDTSQDTGYNLYLKYPNPTSFGVVNTEVGSSFTTTSISGGPIVYFSNLFKYWRGSWIVRLKFPKTMYHTGRLQITWTPNRTVTSVPDVSNSDVCLREILDLSTSDEIILTLPYYLQRNYIGISQASGVLQISVLNRLRCPASVDSSINMMVFYSGGPDFEFQVPQATNRTTPYRIGQMKRQRHGTCNIEDIKSTLIEECIGGQGFCSTTIIPASSSIGEMFTSVRQLLTRYTQVRQGGDFTPSVGGYSIWPWFNAGASTNAAGVMMAPAFGGDAFCYISPLYAFYRGGMKIRIYHGNQSNATLYNEPFNSSPGTAVVSTFSTASAMYGTVVNGPWQQKYFGPGVGSTIDASNTINMLNVPYYCPTKVSPNIQMTDSILATIPSGGVYPTSTVGVRTSTLATDFISRAIGEDFQFTYFMGCPPVFLTNVPTPP